MGHLSRRRMSFKVFCCVFTSGDHFAQRSETIIVFLGESHSRNISVKLL